MKKFTLTVVISSILTAIVLSQSSGTPSQIRVKTDALGRLVVAVGAQTLPLSQPSVFTNTRLRTDSSNNLVVVIDGTSSSSPLVFSVPVQIDPVGPLSGTNQTLKVIPTSLGGGEQAFLVDATYNATQTSSVAMTANNATGAGSDAFDQLAFAAGMVAGYTGSSDTYAGKFTTNTASTGKAFGVWGQSTGNSTWSIGAGGYASDGTNRVGGLFSQGVPVYPTLSTGNNALVVLSGATAGDLIAAYDNGTNVFRLRDNGATMSLQAVSGTTDFVVSTASGGSLVNRSTTTTTVVGSTNNVPVVFLTNNATSWTMATDKTLLSAGVAFTALSTQANGTIVYCTDCTKATPCADMGSGALAKRLNGAWDCD